MKISGLIPLGIVASTLSATFLPFSSLTAFLLLPTAAVSIWCWSLSVRGILPSLLLLWLAFVPATLAWSLSPGLSLPQAAVLLCLPLGWLAGSALSRGGQLSRLLNYLLPAMLLTLLMWGLLQGPNTITGKPQGPFNDPNTYAAVLNLLSLPLLARYLADDLSIAPRWLRTSQLALMAGTAFLLFLVSSRGATLAILPALVPVLWMARNQLQFRCKLLLLSSVATVTYVAALAASGGLSSVAQRLANTVQGGDPSRIMLLQSAWLMIQEHPWFGTGLGTFRMLYPQYRYLDETGTGGGWVHNDYLQLWLEAGLPMFLLMLGLVLWVARAVWRTIRQGGREALLRMGYLAGIAAILLHALVNFLFFFALVSLLVGLYLARVGRPDEPAKVPIHLHQQSGSGNNRAMWLATGGYTFLLGHLLLGQVAVEGFLGEAHWIQRTLFKWQIVYPRYQVAHWISVLAPFHPAPHQIMGLELSDGFFLNGSTDEGIRDEALKRMEDAWKRAPCYLPYANDALAVIQPLVNGNSLMESLRSRGQLIVVRNLGCNARHGLSYYHAGGLARTDAEAMMWWRAGLAASLFLGDRLLLATAVLSRTTPGQERALAELAAQMARSIRSMEANPSIHADQVFWSESQYKLYRIAGKRFLELVRPSNAIQS